MKEYLKARNVYCRNIIIGIGVGLYLLVFRIDWAEKLVYGVIDDVFPPAREVAWSVILILLYGIIAAIRKSGGKEDAYDGRLRILPKIYLGYLLLNIVLTILMYG